MCCFFFNCLFAHVCFDWFSVIFCLRSVCTFHSIIGFQFAHEQHTVNHFFYVAKTIAIIEWMLLNKLCLVPGKWATRQCVQSNNHGPISTVNIRNMPLTKFHCYTHVVSYKFIYIYNICYKICSCVKFASSSEQFRWYKSFTTRFEYVCMHRMEIIFFFFWCLCVCFLLSKRKIYVRCLLVLCARCRIERHIHAK